MERKSPNRHRAGLQPGAYSYCRVLVADIGFGLSTLFGAHSSSLPCPVHVEVQVKLKLKHDGAIRVVVVTESYKFSALQEVRGNHVVCSESRARWCVLVC